MVRQSGRAERGGHLCCSSCANYTSELTYELFSVFALSTHHRHNFTYSCFSAPCVQIRACEDTFKYLVLLFLRNLDLSALSMSNELVIAESPAGLISTSCCPVALEKHCLIGSSSGIHIHSFRLYT